MLEDKAKELGRLIGQSAEYKAVKRANEELSGDREAVALLRELEKLREDAQSMIARGEQPTEEMEQKLDELLGKVQSHRVYQAVAVAQENFDKLMMRANEWILDGIKKGAQSPIITLG
ncbi:MAG TPA: YlbF family regulator [Gemmatimonadaceae bacterium]|nr:YlbF family regulator [Gemmatimonadaceae bacterium]